MGYIFNWLFVIQDTFTLH